MTNFGKLHYGYITIHKTTNITILSTLTLHLNTILSTKRNKPRSSFSNDNEQNYDECWDVRYYYLKTYAGQIVKWYTITTELTFLTVIFNFF